MSTVARPRPPSVEQVLVRLRRSAGHEGRDPQALAEAARAVIDDERRRLGHGAAARTTDKLASEAERLLSGFAEPAATARSPASPTPPRSPSPTPLPKPGARTAIN